MESSIKTQNSVIPMTLLACFPFIQWGASTYLSVQLICFLLLLFVIDYKAAALKMPAIIFIGLMMSISTLTYINSPYFLHSFLKIWREALCLFVILAIHSTIRYSGADDRPLKWTTIILVIAILSSTLLQLIFYRFFSSTVFFIPEHFYTGDFGTIADKWASFAEKHSLTMKIRPSSFYAEPSYVGFVSLSILAIILKTFADSKTKTALIAMLMVALVLSETLSGIFSFAIFLIAFYKNKIRYIHPMILVSILLLTPVYFILFPLPDFFTRLFQIGNSNAEISGYIRLILPFDLISKVWIYSPLGVPLNELFDFLGQSTVRLEDNPFTTNYQSQLRLTGLDNAFLNFFIFYGILGFIILYIISRQIRDLYYLYYLFLTSIFNGSILSFDKTVVICTVFIIIKQWPTTTQIETYRNAKYISSERFAASVISK